MSNTTHTANTNRFKAQTPPKLMEALVAIKLYGPATAKEIGVSPANMNRAKNLGLVTVDHTINTAVAAGRPAHVWTLTATGKKRAARKLASLDADA